MCSLDMLVMKGINKWKAETSMLEDVGKWKRMRDNEYLKVLN